MVDTQLIADFLRLGMSVPSSGVQYLFSTVLGSPYGGISQDTGGDL